MTLYIFTIVRNSETKIHSMETVSQLSNEANVKVISSNEKSDQNVKQFFY